MKRIPSLDGLRAISILLVLFGHLAYSLGVQSWITGAYAHAGVLIFFVISGFLITTLIQKEVKLAGKLDIKQFYIRRAWRILPVAFVYLAIVTTAFHSQFSWSDIGLSWGYLACYAPSLPWVLSHLWSLSVEEQFYLLWPITFKLRNSVIVALAAILIAPICRFAFEHAGKYTAASFAFPAVFDSIAVGCLLSIMWTKLTRIRAIIGYGWLAWPSAMCLPLLHNVGRIHRFFHLPQLVGHSYWTVFNILVAVGVCWAVQAAPWVLNNPPIMWIGLLSYSLYLFQMPWMNPSWHISIFIRLVGTGVCAVGGYYLIEQPALQLRKKGVNPKVNPFLSRV